MLKTTKSAERNLRSSKLMEKNIYCVLGSEDIILLTVPNEIPARLFFGNNLKN